MNSNQRIAKLIQDNVMLATLARQIARKSYEGNDTEAATMYRRALSNYTPNYDNLPEDLSDLVAHFLLKFEQGE